MTNCPHAHLARRIAARLTSLDPSLPGRVEDALDEDDSDGEQRRTLDDMSLAALASVVIVTAQLLLHVLDDVTARLPGLEQELPQIIPGLRDLLPAEREQVIRAAVAEAHGRAVPAG